MNNPRRKSLGVVAHIRLRPQDCTAVYDVVAAVGYNHQNISFNQACRIAMSALLDSAKSSGGIPTREGFEYLELMGKYKKDDFTPQPYDLIRKPIPEMAPADYHVPSQDKNTKEYRRCQELFFLRVQDPLNWTKMQEMEFMFLQQFLTQEQFKQLEAKPLKDEQRPTPEELEEFLNNKGLDK